MKKPWIVFSAVAAAYVAYVIVTGVQLAGSTRAATANIEHGARIEQALETPHDSPQALDLLVIPGLVRIDTDDLKGMTPEEVENLRTLMFFGEIWPDQDFMMALGRKLLPRFFPGGIKGKGRGGY